MKTSSFFSYRGDGRICIARFAPRGMPKGYRVFKKLAPGAWFNSVDRAAYITLYTREVLSRLDPQETWDELHALAGGHEPVLLCYERPPFSDENFCHRRLVAEWFEKALGVQVPEL